MSTTSRIANEIAAAEIEHPINWDDMGSSEKDLWEERTLRMIAKRNQASEGAAMIRPRVRRQH